MKQEFATKARVLGLATIVGLGSVSCSAPQTITATGSETTKTTCSAQTGGDLTDLRLIGPSKSGGTNAVNAGECVRVINPVTGAALGAMAAEQAFIINCFDTAPAPNGGLRITINDEATASEITGNVYISESVSTELTDATDQPLAFC